MATLSLTETRATQIRTKLEKMLTRYNTKEHGANERWYIKVGGMDDHGCDVQVYALENGNVAVSLDDYGIVSCVLDEYSTLENAGLSAGEQLVKMLNKPSQKNADAQPWSSSCWHICWN